VVQGGERAGVALRPPPVAEDVGGEVIDERLDERQALALGGIVLLECSEQPQGELLFEVGAVLGQQAGAPHEGSRPPADDVPDGGVDEAVVPRGPG
jgi:hypothetical protein